MGPIVGTTELMISNYTELLDKVSKRMQHFETIVRPWNFIPHVQEGILRVHEITDSRNMTSSGFTDEAVDVIAILLLACGYIAQDEQREIDQTETEKIMPL